MAVSKVCDIGSHWQCVLTSCECICHRPIRAKEVNFRLNHIDEEWLDECAKLIQEEIDKNAKDSSS